MALPRPNGPYGVGSVTHELLDPDRAAHLASEAPGRRLLLKLWYPAERTAAATERLWAEARREAPRPMRWLLRCLPARTSTVPHARLATLAAPLPLVVYNHGLISFAAENTSLMEELASQGYAVIAVQHAEQLLELRALTSSQPAEIRQAHTVLERQLRAAPTAEKARLARDYYAAAENTARIVTERCADTSFVLNNAGTVLACIPGVGPLSIGGASALLVGFSVGGAVATATAERDSRIRGVVNLDGGLYGSWNAREIQAPYLMMYSAANSGLNDELLPPQAERVTPAGTKHLNYHDVAALLPLLRYAGATGSANPSTFIAHRNQAVRAFLAQAAPAGSDHGKQTAFTRHPRVGR